MNNFANFAFFAVSFISVNSFGALSEFCFVKGLVNCHYSVMDLSYATPPSASDLAALRAQAPSPCYIVDSERIERNCALLDRVQSATGATILLALKGFSMYSLFPLVRKYLRGVTASGIHEALLGREYFGGEVHAYSPAFREDEITRLVRVADHLVFNSPAQWQRHRSTVQGAPRSISCGLRVNPEYSSVEVDLYNPCAPCSRLGTTAAQLAGQDITGLEGLHFHVLCEQNVDALEGALAAFEAKFGHLIPHMQWINFGGGHHITRPDYGVERLIELINDFRGRHDDIAVYLEPGEAIALDSGYLLATVLDIVDNGMKIAILDTSATCHMPDVLEMPYRPRLIHASTGEEAGEAGSAPYTYRFGGPSCLAGDIIGDYAFSSELAVGDRLIFLDMAHYTMVKTTTFNGVPLPSIAQYNSSKQKLTPVRHFGYEDYRMRLS